MTDAILPRPALPAASAAFERTLRRAQAVAGALFALFVLLHLSNIAIAPFGIEAFNSYQRTIRQFYQYPLVELGIVILPLTVHMIAGIWLILLRHGHRVKRPLRARLHSWAGGFLMLVIVGHILAVRGSSFFYDVFAEFQGLSFSLWYFPAYFYPYYFLLALAGFYHATGGLLRFAAMRGLRMSPRTHGWITLVAAAWIVISLAALGGWLFDTGDVAAHPFATLLGDLSGMDPRTPIR